MAKITVVIPVYKVECYLHRCLDSVINQNFSDYDVVIVDDGSPDNCGKICDYYARKYQNIIAIHQENQGLSAARNTGIEWSINNSDSEWITFIDSDDWVHNTYLQSLYRAVTDTGLSVAVGGYVTSEGTDPFNSLELTNSFCISPETLYCNNNIQFTTAWGKLYKKKVFRKFRYPVGKLHEDEFITWKILFQYDKIAVIDKPIYAYFINTDGIIKSSWSLKRLDALDAFEERLLFFNKEKKYPKARDALISHYQWHLIDSIKQVSEKYSDNHHLKRSLIRRLRRFFLEADYSILEHEGLYEIAYPRISKYKWAIAMRKRGNKKG